MNISEYRAHTVQEILDALHADSIDDVFDGFYVR